MEMDEWYVRDGSPLCRPVGADVPNDRLTQDAALGWLVIRPLALMDSLHLTRSAFALSNPETDQPNFNAPPSQREGLPKVSMRCPTA